LGSFIFGLPSDREQTFVATAAVAEQAELTFAQFVMLTPYPGTVDFARWEKTMFRLVGTGLFHPHSGPKYTLPIRQCQTANCGSALRAYGIIFIR
jgi:hypothetical protein